MIKDFSQVNTQMFDHGSRVKMAKQIISLLQLQIPEIEFKEKKVLDMGCSTGYISNKLASKFGQVIGIDNDSSAIKFAQSKFKSKNLKFLKMDASKTSFADNKFDLIICNQVFTCVADPKKLFNEIYRLLRPGGICLVSGRNKYWPVKPSVKGMVEYKSFWGLKKLCRNFEIHYLTREVVKLKTGYTLPITNSIWEILEPLSPNFVWILTKQ